MKTKIKHYKNKSALHKSIKEAFEKSNTRQRKHQKQMLKSSILR